MKTLTLIIFTVIGITLLVSCDKEIGRISVYGLSTPDSLKYNELIIVLQDDTNISFWSDLNIEYEGQLYLNYIVEIYSGNKKIYSEKFNALNSSVVVNEKKLQVDNKIRWQFQGKMGSFNCKKSGNYTLRTWILSNGNESLITKRSDLVIKQ